MGEEFAMRIDHPLHKVFVSVCAISLILIGFLSASQYINAASSTTSTSDADYAVGDNIIMGNLDGNVIAWTILSYDSSTGDALLITRYPYTKKYYTDFMKTVNAKYTDKSKIGYVNWSNSMYRTFCQNFYKDAFTKAEKALITKTIISSKSQKNSIMNFYHDTSLDAYYVANQTKNSLSLDICNNQANTTDYVFFLSYDEFVSYGDGIEEGTTVYPLRTNAYDEPGMSLFVNESTGLIERRYHYSGTSVRPAMWVNLSSYDEDEETSGTNSGSTSSSSDSTSSTSSSDTSSTDTTTSTALSYSTIVRRTYDNNATDNSASVANKIKLPDTGEYTISKNKTAQVTLDMSYLNSTNKDYSIEYSTSDSNVFDIDASGKITAGSESGAAVLTVRMKKSNGKILTMTCNITVE